ncbi:protein MULTIPOLAR SPINDLE 1 [Sesbania bispinosa]|nr:protein MULTIPOLAR SPINDLE 1 [Sesbania bispinosa]
MCSAQAPAVSPVSSDCKRKFEDLQPEPIEHRPLESNSNTDGENKRPCLDDNEDDLANANDESLKLAIAVSLLRSKLLKNTKESNALSPTQSEALCCWKRKAKERKQEILRLKEDLKEAQDASHYDVFPENASCKLIEEDETEQLRASADFLVELCDFILPVHDSKFTNPGMAPEHSRFRLREMMKGLMCSHGYGYGVVVIVVLALSFGASAEQLSSRECENPGFTSLALCFDCNISS